MLYDQCTKADDLLKKKKDRHLQDYTEIMRDLSALP